MAEETSGIQNKKLLIISVALGLLVVIVYNWHIHNVRERSKPQTVDILQFRRNLSPGEQIAKDDLTPVSIETKYESSLGKVARAKELDFLIGKRVNQAVEKGWWFQWNYIDDDVRNRPSAAIEKGMIAFPLEIDSQRAPGTLLQIGDRVNVVAMLPDAQKKVRALTVIEGAKVLTIGQKARGGFSEAGTYRDEAMRSYRQIMLELPTDVARQLANVLTHRQGDVWVEVVSARSEFPGIPQINKDVASLAGSAEVR